ncbi:MAG: methylated-DNA--[protein]-cysteine S-methyltransferase, partial [Phenylobacterium sp.]|nr:methylated-DNA--[protein]-cysteine S-methyltransferase [Phenylobacterium sp.]
MSGPGFVIFETAIGACALAWSPNGVCGVRFPHPGRGAVEAEARRTWPQARPLEPPSEVAAIVADVKALLAGEPRDFGDVAIDLSGVPDFQRRVYNLARAIPCG